MILPDGDERRERWIERYVEKYEPGSETMAEFVGSHLVIEVEPDRAFGIVEREDEFSTPRPAGDSEGRVRSQCHATERQVVDLPLRRNPPERSAGK